MWSAIPASELRFERGVDPPGQGGSGIAGMLERPGMR
jgi:hypothetical protein